MVKLCGGGSQMLGKLPRMKEKQTDLLCSQGGIIAFFQREASILHRPVCRALKTAQVANWQKQQTKTSSVDGEINSN